MRHLRHGPRGGRRLAAPVALFASAALVLAGSAATGTNTKPYTPTFSPTPPATVPGGTTTTVHLHIVNNAGQQAIQSANINAPGAFKITSVSPALNVASSFDDAQVRLRQISIAPAGGTYDLDISVETPCAGGTYTWAVIAKQSNDFNGPPGNDFNQQSASLTTKVASAPLDHFTLATVGNQIAGPPGFKVTATAWDTCGAKKTDYAGGASLSGTLGTSGVFTPAYGSFAAGSFVNANGSAQSSNTVAIKAETGVTLTATAAGQAGTSLASNPFDVTGGAPYSAQFVQQPTDSQVSTTITPAVTVQATDQYGNLSSGYQLSLGITPGSGATGAKLSNGGPAAATMTNGSGIATFDSLSIDKVGGPAAGTPKYTLDAKYGGVKLQTAASATSAGFSVDLVTQDCDPSLASCALPKQELPSPKNTTTTFQATVTDTVDGGFTGLGFDLAGAIPVNVLAAGGGCAYFVSSGAPGVVLEIRPFAQGVLEMDYGIPTKLIQASPNNGNKFVPICAHARRVDANGLPIDCDNDPGGPFKSRILDVNGVLTGAIGDAVCDRKDAGGTGEWWGILPTYQDPVDPVINPIISGWTSGTALDGTNLRIFTIRVYAPWDWGHSG